MNARDIREIAQSALSSAESVLAHWLPQGKRQGPEYLAINPTRSDSRDGSFSVNINTGRWADFATDDKGGDLVSLVAYLEGGCTQSEAAHKIAVFLGLPSPGDRIAGNTAEKRPKATPVPPVPAPVPLESIPVEALESRPQAHSKHGPPSATWEYRDGAGRPLCFVCRFDPPNSRKQFAPLTWIKGDWQWKAPPEPRPLYGLDALAQRPAAPVLVVEGEKAADAARDLLPEFVTVTTMNGAQSPGKADFSPLKGRRLFIWPDNDNAGTKYALTVAGLAVTAGADSPALLDLSSLAIHPGTKEPRSLPKGWDAADAAADGWTPATLNEAATWMPAASKAAKPETFPGKQHQAALPAPFVSGASGIFYERTAGGKAGGSPPPVWICGPLRIIALTRDHEGQDFGRLLEFEDPDNHTQREVVPAADWQGSGEGVRARLARQGLDISTNPEARRLFLELLQRSRPQARARSTSQTGWTPSGPPFVLPDRTIGEGTEPVIFQSETAEGPGFAVRGTLEQWQRGAAALAVGNTRVVFAMCCAFAAPLLEITGDESGGFHLRGSSMDASSSGKTTTQKAAASTCGPPDFVQKWRGTDNGLEAMAEQHNDALLILDEIAQHDPRTIGETAYMLANGAGKARAVRTGDARKVKRWRLLVLSSGEISLSEHMAAAGKKARAGQEVRMAEIPADAGGGYGAFEELHGYPDGGAFARALSDSAAEHYGTAFPAFVEALIRERQELATTIKRLREKFVDGVLSGLSPSGQVRRVAARFALVAVGGELATVYGVTGWPQGEAHRAAQVCFRAWLQSRGGAGSAEQSDLLKQVSAFFELHGESRFTPWERAERGDDHMPRTSNRAGFVRGRDGGGLHWYVLPEVFRLEIAAGFDSKEAAGLLLQKGLILPPKEDSGRTTQKVRLPGFKNPKRVYVFDMEQGDSE